MPGGLLNLTAVGNQNVFLTGNPKKTFFKTTYSHYTNFGMQKFRIDFEGSKTLNLNEKTHYLFKVPRHADLLMDTFLSIRLPNIWSTIYYNNDINEWVPYEFQWIENLGTQIISEISLDIGGVKLQRFSGEYLTALFQRDFSGAKKRKHDKMIGNVDELKNPAKFVRDNLGYVKPYNISTFAEQTQSYIDTSVNSNRILGNEAYYPNSIRFDETGNGNDVLITEPSIRGRYLQIPLNLWYMLSSKLAFPLLCLQYNELHINVTLRPIKEWFTINNVSGTTVENSLTRVQPNFTDPEHAFYKFIHPTPQFQTDSDPTRPKRSARLVWTDTRTTFNSDVHLICTYGFLDDDERRSFAQNEQTYLFKSIFEYDFHGLHESNIVDLPALGMVTSLMWYFRRSDANARNEWSNYTNYDYNNKNLFIDDVLKKPLFLESSRTGVDALRFLYTPSYNQKYESKIMRNFAIMMNGKYRETNQISDVYNYLETYLKTPGEPPSGLYCYNFCLNTDPFVYQPSGAMNFSKFKNIQLEFTLLKPPLNPSVQVLTACDPETGAVVGIQETGTSIFKYTYDLHVIEERYNSVIFSNGTCGLLYAR